MKKAGFRDFWKKQKNSRIQQSLGRPDYRVYVLGPADMLIAVLLGLIVDAAFAYLFYRSIWAVLFLLPMLPVVFLLYYRKKLEGQKKRLRGQFKDAMQSICAALQAGYSVENAIYEAAKDMETMYTKEGMICKELYGIYEGIRNAQTPESLFLSLADRSSLEEIQDFAEVFEIAKRMGGDLPGVIKASSSTIADKVETEGEIETAIASKRLEGRMMDLIPFFIIVYIDMTSPGFFAPLYNTLLGKIVMTVLLIGYIGAILLSEKIMKIEV